MIRKSITLVASISAFWLCIGRASAADAPEKFLIKDGDRVVVYGDSITDNQLYPRILEDFIVTRYPNWTVEFHNRGWGGDTAHYYGRFRRDCLALKPNVAIICLGMNDADYRPFQKNLFTTYVRFLDRMAEDLKATGSRVVFVSPPTYDVQQGPTLKHPADHKVRDMAGYPEVLREFSLGMLAVAQVHDLPYVDVNQRYAELLAVGRARYGTQFRLTRLGDAVHPYGPGQLAMAVFILEGIGAPSLVAALEIDAAQPSVVDASRSEVSDLKREGESITFTRLNESLPLPMYDATEPVATMLNVADRLNRDILKFAYLPAGRYKLSIDGRHIVTRTAAQWADGVNLSQFAYTPQMQQARRVAELTEQVHQARYRKWRKILLKGVTWVGDASPFDLSDAAALKDADLQIKRLLAERRILARPKSRRYVLQRVD